MYRVIRRGRACPSRTPARHEHKKTHHFAISGTGKPVPYIKSD